MTLTVFRYYDITQNGWFYSFYWQELQSDAVAQADGDPELLDDSEFYQQLLKEFFEIIDPTSSGKTLVTYIIIYAVH